MLLPELGDARPSDDRATLFEAIRCGLTTMASHGPVAILLDDLQWSDDATLEFLAMLAPTLEELPLLIVAAYRSDELPAPIRCAGCATTCAASAPWRSSRSSR